LNRRILCNCASDDPLKVKIKQEKRITFVVLQPDRQRLGTHRWRGRAGQATSQKTTPLGSKYRVPAAPMAGPLKSPVTRV
jgi:hypothetical protein